jgi:uncharacterized protein
VISILPLLLAAALAVHPMKGPREVWRCSRFVANGLMNRRSINSWLSAGELGGLGRSLQSRPEMLGIVDWPYLHKDWTVPERFQAVRDHYAELALVPWLRVGVNETCVISDLDDLHPGLRIILDRTPWFQREGELTLSLRIDDDYVYCLAFLLGRVEGSRAALIGAMQGRSLDGIQDVYRTLTKAFHGARPRDFLFTVFQILVKRAGVERVRGVSDECRHHRHPYFGIHTGALNSANYNDIWADRNGVPVPGGFYELPSAPLVREDGEIPARKRAMYRKRYAFFDRITTDIDRFADGHVFLKAKVTAENR